MAKSGRHAKLGTEAYSDAEFDREFLRVLGSDWIYVATRLVMLVIVYWLLARAIVQFDLSASFLLLPLAAEILLMMWIGWLLSVTLVDCPAFTHTAGRGGQVIFWSVFILVIASGVIVIEDQTLDFGRLLPGWRVVGERVLETGLIWAMVVEGVGLVLATIPEVRRWRRTGGKFIWTPIFDLALRLAAIVLLVVFGIFVFALLADFIAPWLADGANRESWLVYALLVVVEVGGLAIGIKIHSDLVSKSKDPATITGEAFGKKGAAVNQ